MEASELASSPQSAPQTPQLGIVGGGVMAEVLIRGITSAGLFRGPEILVATPRPRRRQYLAERYGVTLEQDNRLAAAAPHVLLAIKPQQAHVVLAELAPLLRPHHLLISIMAGVSLSRLAGMLPIDIPMVRVMTNTPCTVGMGMSVLTPNTHVGAGHLSWAQALFAAVGDVTILDEGHMDAVTAVSGSGPAFILLFLEALIDAGVLQGLPRSVARDLVVQTVMGTAKLLREAGKHPGELRDMVTTPAGTTIAGLQVLEEYKIRAALLKTVEIATQRAQQLGAAF